MCFLPPFTWVLQIQRRAIAMLSFPFNNWFVFRRRSKWIWSWLWGKMHLWWPSSELIPVYYLTPGHGFMTVFLLSFEQMRKSRNSDAFSSKCHATKASSGHSYFFKTILGPCFSLCSSGSCAAFSSGRLQAYGNPPASASWVVGLWTFSIMPGFSYAFLISSSLWQSLTLRLMSVALILLRLETVRAEIGRQDPTVWTNSWCQ